MSDQRKGHMATAREHPSTGQGDRSQEKPTLPDLGLPASKLWENKCVFESHLACGALFWPPKQADTQAPGQCMDGSDPPGKEWPVRWGAPFPWGISFAGRAGCCGVRAAPLSTLYSMAPGWCHEPDKGLELWQGKIAGTRAILQESSQRSAIKSSLYNFDL